MRLFILIASIATLAACGRSLSTAEESFAAEIFGPSIEPARIRFIDGALVGQVTQTRAPRPRLACRERILPKPRGDTVKVSPAGVAIHNRIFFASDWYRRDYLPDWPQRMRLGSAMLLAHELTHIWQWQNREVTGYSPLRAASEHGVGTDPYLFDIDTGSEFLDFGYEQQAGIVEEYVCCAALDPHAPRTRRLAGLLRGAFPIQRLTIPDTVALPWPDAQTKDICR
ncbi:hypothetical protein DQW77_00180 [Roseovarius sp. TE539]|uniref:hypothetical protein n=1 Tax=Roseovarius sp. TE539 TaxID=2249812 RepID=UPI000DDD722C|nr:hypothetical protein [Roseovarius sp. TE539]RBI77468.1 hypothetical protein DQW77_00180 [Roseovarius sp. TE539]